MEANEERVDIEECKNCRFYEMQEYETAEGISYERTFGMCRRFPPKRIDGTISGFPVVEEDWWCGEHLKNTDTSDIG